MNTGFRAFSIITFIVTTALAQSNQWPVFFGIPQKVTSRADSARLTISSNAKVFESYEKNQTTLEWQPALDAARLVQRSTFETSHEEMNHATNQYIDLSGKILKDSILPGNGNLGLEWTPVSFLNVRQSGGGFQTTGDLGPLIEMNMYDIPVMVKGGISGNSWSDSLPSPVSQSRMNDVHGAAGFYGACRIGDTLRPVPGTSLYANGGAFVRSINQAGLAVVTGSALFAHGLGNGDSLFAYYGDSLSNGKENFWGSAGAGNRQQYVNTPWRIARSYLAAGGIKSKERFGFQPSVIYSFAENSVAYPTLQSVLSDVKERLHSLNFQLGTKSSLPVLYQGGLKISWGDEEWLFASDLSERAFSNRPPTPRQLDSLRIKLGDYGKYQAISDHALSITLPHELQVTYKLSAYRDSRTYTFSYKYDSNNDGIPDTIRNNDDNDRITVNNHLGISRSQFHGMDAEVYGEYSTYTLNFLKKERSADNYTEDGFRLGLNLQYRPSERFFIDERISADAEISDFLYKQVHIDPFDPPPYKRRFASLFSTVWNPFDGWELHGRWVENLYDNGYWYGREYRKKDAQRETGDFYAIENKTIDYTLEAGCAMVRTIFRLEGGCLFREIYDQRFEENVYRTSRLTEGHVVEPYTEFRLKYRSFSLKGRVTRMIRTRAEDIWQFRKNWDITIMGSAVW
jgi:hypothetical protein